MGINRPGICYGINLGADWNSFFFSAFFQGVGKQDWFPSSEASVFWGQYNRPYNPLPRWQLDNHWTPENPDAYMPRYVGRVANRSGGILTNNPQTAYLAEYRIYPAEKYPVWLQPAYNPDFKNRG